ncbi:metalloregulator ArsR/SmtB family transcription factor [Aestuariicella hydrocarbonica]|uniref:Metalloregulator ArsR/SmtB family transcription factor n=1 Tax=Pseudomaricurvus hydrocarbonicus TaxID=1470433 RepID=A0A9E5JSZ4_9GAMM|nr:metalloregulator ArsR/SmtB family transcription factor [Aestuariicella hydrocarbonica]NHO66282.1 metalloregulator ArsR/SmtB family transcription factor [Aestuariicella hydrocarbonica]
MDISDYANVFKALSEPVRLRIVCLLLESGELCVCDIVAVLGVSQSVVSRHLAYLRNSGLVVTRREGVWVYYQLLQTAGFVAGLLALIQTEAASAPAVRGDLRTLAEKEGAGCC